MVNYSAVYECKAYKSFFTINNLCVICTLMYLEHVEAFTILQITS